MTCPPVLPSQPHPSLAPPQNENPSHLLPVLWSQLDRRHQQQLAHCLADLIRRIRRPPTNLEDESHEPR